jgi:hypothetical protein
MVYNMYIINVNEKSEHKILVRLIIHLRLRGLFMFLRYATTKILPGKLCFCMGKFVQSLRMHIINFSLELVILLFTHVYIT